MTKNNTRNQRMTCRPSGRNVSIHILITEQHKNTLDQIRATLGRIIGKTPSHTLVFRRALSVYAAHLSGLDDDDLKAEHLRLSAVDSR